MDENDNQKLLDGHEPLQIESPEQKLQAEIASLKKQLEEERHKNREKHAPKRPGKKGLWIAAVGILVLLLLGFFIGWLPRYRRNSELQKEAAAEKRALPQVNFVRAERSAPNHELLLPGTIEAETDAPILARADGYIKHRYADIGDRVKKDQLLARLEAPDLDQQVAQARAQLSQATAAQRQSLAALQQGKANEELARVTAVRYQHLVDLDAVSRQDNDTQQANYKAQTENVNALAQAVDAAAQNTGSAKANFDRLIALQSYEDVRAPFDGVVTLRNIDNGALVSTGSTLLFRVAQIDQLRTYIYVPQSDASSVQVGQPAQLYSVELGGHNFTGTIRRTANSLDPSSRTLLTEVHVPNPQLLLLPGMFVQVSLNDHRANPPVLIPGDCLLVRSNGTLVAVLQNYHRVTDDQQQNNQSGGDEKPNGQKSQNQNSSSQKPKEVLEGKIHLVPVRVGRDYGNAIEIYNGVDAGQFIITSPNDSVREGAQVRATEGKVQLDQIIGSPNGSRTDANSEKLQNAPGAEPIPKQPSVEKKTRGGIQ